jgi:hypothetical protein
VPRHSPRWVKGAAPISNPSRPGDPDPYQAAANPQRMRFLHFSFEVWKHSWNFNYAPFDEPSYRSD